MGRRYVCTCVQQDGWGVSLTPVPVLSPAQRLDYPGKAVGRAAGDLS